jgi:hypothetical protein
LGQALGARRTGIQLSLAQSDRNGE